jgi:hypothetical protein
LVNKSLTALAFHLGALAAARGVPVRKVLRQRGWSKSTFYRKLDGGAARIAAILGERGVVVR